MKITPGSEKRVITKTKYSLLKSKTKGLGAKREQETGTINITGLKAGRSGLRSIEIENGEELPITRSPGEIGIIGQKIQGRLFLTHGALTKEKKLSVRMSISRLEPMSSERDGNNDLVETIKKTKVCQVGLSSDMLISVMDAFTSPSSIAEKFSMGEISCLSHDFGSLIDNAEDEYEKSSCEAFLKFISDEKEWTEKHQKDNAWYSVDVY